MIVMMLVEVCQSDSGAFGYHSRGNAVCVYTYTCIGVPGHVLVDASLKMFCNTVLRYCLHDLQNLIYSGEVNSCDRLRT